MPTLARAASADLDDTVVADTLRVHQIRLLYDNLRAGLRLSGAGLLMLMAAVRLLGPMPASVLLWGSLTLAWIGMGFVMHWIYRHKATDQTLQGWAIRAAVGSAIAGVLWGGIGFCLLDPVARPLAPLFIAVVCMVALGVYAAYACYPPAMYGFVLGVTLTFCVAMILVAERMHLAIATFLAVTAVLALISGRNFNRLLTSEIVTRTRNDRLVRELTAKQAEVESANLAKTRFLAAASHDLRQPVHAINLYAEVLKEQIPPGDGRVALQSMSKSIQALDGLFESIEDIAKFEAGIVTARIAEVDLETVFESLRANHEEGARAKGLQLHIPRGEWVLRSDGVLLRRILGNLISNAIRYTDSGSVHVEIEANNGTARITVRDTGIGIPADRIDDVFREYVQLHNPERNRDAGLGLGLNIVKRLADLLGHPLSVRSVVGKGTDFTIEIPVSAAAAARSPGITAASDDARALSGTFVAIIDDEAAVLESTRLLLNSWRCHVLTAVSGDEALNLLQREERLPDLLISDFRLRNDESGIEVIQRIRSALQVQIPAMLISGDIAPARVREAYDKGLPLLHKPVPAARLRTMMIELLASNSAAPSS